jgi:hypothetical protein
MVLQANFAKEENEMNTKLRTIIVAFVASASIGVAPTVSQAQDASGNSTAADCQNDREAAKGAIELATKYAAEGDYETAATWSQIASGFARLGQTDCAMAAAEGLSPTKVVVAPVGGISTVAVTTPPVRTVFHPKTGKTTTSTVTVKLG